MRVGDMIPRSGFLPAYVREAAKLTDASPVFHVACASTLLGAMVAKYTSVRMLDGEKISSQPPLLWTICIGATSDFKTYAVLKASDLFRPLLKGRYFSVGGSREGMEDLLMDTQDPVFVAPEVPQWFQMNRAGWARNGAQMWCELYDGFIRPQHFRRKPTADDGAGTEIPVSIALLGAGATDAIMDPKCTRPTDWQGGLFVRVLWISGTPTRNTKDDGYEWTEDQLQSLRAMLTEILGWSRKVPSVTLTKQARLEYQSWCRSLRSQRIGMPDTNSLVLKRLNVHVRRLAGIYAISRMSENVTGDDISRACLVGDKARESVQGLSFHG